MWIARDSGGNLFKFPSVPVYTSDDEWVVAGSGEEGEIMDPTLCPDVTFERSPIEISCGVLEICEFCSNHISPDPCTLLCG